MRVASSAAWAAAVVSMAATLGTSGPALAQAVEPDAQCRNAAFGELLGTIGFDRDGSLVVRDRDGGFLAFAPDVCIPIAAERKVRQVTEEDRLIGLFKQAVIAIGANDDAGAVPLLEEIIGADPAFAHAYLQLGLIHARLGDTAKAAEMLKLYLEHARTDDPSRREAEAAIAAPG
jgi:hypothetical protein